MTKGLNKCSFIGNLGADPEVKYMPSGDAVASFSIGVSEKWTDKTTGQKKEKTEWVRVVTFRKLAEIVSEYLRKGSQVYIEGKIQTKKWQDQSGNDRYTTEIVANEMLMLGGRSDSGQQAASPAPASQAQDDFDKDLPF